MTVRLFTHQGHTDTLAGWAARIGISREALSQRLETGWPVAIALSTPRYGRLSKKNRPRAPRTDAHTMFALLVAYVRHHEAMKRQLNDTLRLFINDVQQQLYAHRDSLAVDLLGNPDPSIFIDREVGNNFAETLPDRLVPSAQDSQNIEFSQCP